MRFHLKIKKKLDWYAVTYYSIVLSITYLMMPLLRGFLPEVITHVIMIFFMMLSIIGIIIQNRSVRYKNILKMGMVFVFILLTYYGKWVLRDSRLENNTFTARITQLYTFWMFYLLSINASNFSNNDKKRLLHYFLGLTFITATTTSIGLFYYPMAARLLAGWATPEEAILFRRLNIGGYEFIYGLMLLFPYIVYFLYKYKGKQKQIFFWAFLIMSVLALIMSQYATAFVLAFLAIILPVMFQSKRTRIIAFFFVILFILLFCTDILSDILIWIRDLFLQHKFTTMAERINQIISYLRGNDWYGTSQARAQYRIQSINVFLENPLFGCFMNPKPLGEHSEIFDTMAESGILGLSIFVYFIIDHVKRFFCINKDVLLKTVFIVDCILFVILAFIDTLFTSPDIALVFFLIPSLLIQNDAEDIWQVKGDKSLVNSLQ